MLWLGGHCCGVHLISSLGQRKEGEKEVGEERGEGRKKGGERERREGRKRERENREEGGMETQRQCRMDSVVSVSIRHTALTAWNRQLVFLWVLCLQLDATTSVSPLLPALRLVPSRPSQYSLPVTVGIFPACGHIVILIK